MTIDFSLIVVILNFVLLMIILNNLLYKPLKGFFTDRQKKIQNDLTEAEQSIEEARRLALEKDNELKMAMEDARKIRDNTRREAETQAEKVLIEAKIREHQIIKQGEEKIEELSSLAKQKIESELASLIADLTGKVLAEKIDEAKDKELINRLLANRG